MPSVMDAAINRAEAKSSFCPSKLLKRLVESIQISSGMLKIRLSVMELGRFKRGHKPSYWPDYPPLCKRKAMEGSVVI